jgi:hypothetical protein
MPRALVVTNDPIYTTNGTTQGGITQGGTMHRAPTLLMGAMMAKTNQKDLPLL